MIVIYLLDSIFPSETGDASSAPAKKKLTLSFVEYRTMSNMLVLHMRKEEERAETEGNRSITSK